MSSNHLKPEDVMINGLINRSIDPLKLDGHLRDAIVGIVDGVLEGERRDLKWLKQILPSAVRNTPHSCETEEHCCALHAAHKAAAEKVEQILQEMIEHVGSGS